MTPLSAVTWRWKPMRGYRSTFGPETVNVLAAMVRRHYPALARFICVTGDTSGLSRDIDVVKPWDDFVSVPSPSGGRNPSCYRRLRMFHPDIGQTFGPRFVSLDLDMVMTGDLQPVWDRTEDFVVLSDTNPRTYYNGSMILMNAGARPQVWETFDPIKSPMASRAAGHFGSDQAHLSHCLGPNEATWTPADGVYSFQKHLLHMNGLPANAKVCVFHGHQDPWDARTQKTHPWIREHYTETQAVAS